MLRMLPMSFDPIATINVAEFARTKEISDRSANLIPNPEQLLYQLDFHQRAKSLTLHSGINLLMAEATMIAYRLANQSSRYKINFIDCLLTSGMSAYYVVESLLQEEILGKYVASTNSAIKNEFAVKTLDLALSHEFPDFAEHSHVFTSDITKEEVGQQVWNVQRSVPEKTRNLFFMSYGSGNLMNPMSTFFNVYNSMNEGDYLMILKNLYGENEDQKIHDLTIYSRVLQGVSVFGSIFNPDFFTPEGLPVTDCIVNYDEQMSGVRVQVPVLKPMQLGGVELEENELITVFRGWYPKKDEFEKMLAKTGLHVVHTTIASDKNAGVFLCQK